MPPAEKIKLNDSGGIIAYIGIFDAPGVQNLTTNQRREFSKNEPLCGNISIERTIVERTNQKDRTTP